MITPQTTPGQEWAQWKSSTEPYTVGIEDEVMLLDAQTLHPAARSADVLAAIPSPLREAVSGETHACVIELKTGVHRDVPCALAELHSLRVLLARHLRPLGLCAASAGTHPCAAPGASATTDSQRYQRVAQSMRWLAEREPTMALHVHVGVAHPEEAIRVLNRLREAVPVLLALSANSPLLHGTDTGFASTRTVIFGGFPRTGPPRSFSSYAEYVESIDPLIASDALPDPTFLWWDVRLQPQLGTVEVRAMDAQTTVADAAPLLALVQALARLELEGAPVDARTGAEVLEENRFLAARDGSRARLIDPAARRLVRAQTVATRLLDRCRPHAAALGAPNELAGLERLMRRNGATRQRTWASHAGSAQIMPELVARFTEDP